MRRQADSAVRALRSRRQVWSQVDLWQDHWNQHWCAGYSAAEQRLTQKLKSFTTRVPSFSTDSPCTLFSSLIFLCQPEQG